MMYKTPKNNVKLRAWIIEKSSDGDVFKDSLKSEDCILILKRRMENIDKKMEELYYALQRKTQKKVRL